MNIIIEARGPARELAVDADLDLDELSSRVETAIQDSSTFDLADSRKERYLIPADAIGCVQMSGQAEYRAGFMISWTSTARLSDFQARYVTEEDAPGLCTKSESCGPFWKEFCGPCALQTSKLIYAVRSL